MRFSIRDNIYKIQTNQQCGATIYFSNKNLKIKKKKISTYPTRTAVR